MTTLQAFLLGILVSYTPGVIWLAFALSSAKEDDGQ